jgi:hypothetical protein
MLPPTMCMFINQNKEQQAQLSSLTVTLQQAYTTIDVSIVIVIMEFHVYSLY